LLQTVAAVAETAGPGEWQASCAWPGPTCCSR